MSDKKTKVSPPWPLILVNCWLENTKPAKEKNEMCPCSNFLHSYYGKFVAHRGSKAYLWMIETVVHSWKPAGHRKSFKTWWTYQVHTCLSKYKTRMYDLITIKQQISTISLNFMLLSILVNLVLFIKLPLKTSSLKTMKDDNSNLKSNQKKP